MDNQHSPILELLKQSMKQNPDYEITRLYSLLDDAKTLIKKSFQNKDNDKYCKKLIGEFSKDCQWAKGWIREEHAKNPAISAEEKARYLKDWTEYIDRIYKWLKTAFKKGKADFIEYKQLENMRDGLFERGSIFYQAKLTHYRKASSMD